MVPRGQEIEITSRLCGACGFVLYTPRPSEEEMDAKYRFLCGFGPDDEISKDKLVIENRRGRLIYRKVKSLLPKGRPVRILDYGGGDGRLMREFIAQGDECYVVDFSDKVIQGIQRLGSTVEDIPTDDRFDLIICSHVIEHVENPLGTVAALIKHLEQEGRIYIEVPMEIWGKAPLQEEPVTHINFFTPFSLWLLMARAGLSVSSCRLGGMPHTNGRMELVIRASGNIGKNMHAGKQLTTNDRCYRTTQLFLRPSARMKLMRYVLMPSTIPKAFVYQLSRLKMSV